MFSLIAVATAALAPYVYASIITSRQMFDPCSGLGDGATSNAGPFTLYAYNPDIATNITGIPLVVAGNLSTFPFGKLGTWASYQHGTLTQPNLESNALTPLGATQQAEAVDLNVPSGSEVESQFYSNVNTPAPAPIYCVIDYFSPPPNFNERLLAVHGDAGSFSLCQNSTGLDAIVYQANVSSGGAYDFATCTSVIVHVQLPQAV